MRKIIIFTSKSLYTFGSVTLGWLLSEEVLGPGSRCVLPRKTAQFKATTCGSQHRPSQALLALRTAIKVYLLMEKATCCFQGPLKIRCSEVRPAGKWGNIIQASEQQD